MSSPICDPEVTKRVTDSLQEIVDKFNVDFKAWGERSQCVADLGWSYREGKALEIRSINLPIFKKPLPGADNESESAPDMKLKDVKKP